MRNIIYQTYKAKRFVQVGAATVKTLEDLIGQDLDGDEVACLIQARTQAVMFRSDGDNPSATVGIQIAAGDSHWFDGDLKQLRMIEATSGAVIAIEVYTVGRTLT